MPGIFLYRNVINGYQHYEFGPKNNISMFKTIFLISYYIITYIQYNRNPYQ